jgi:hypothetical protein
MCRSEASGLRMKKPNFRCVGQDGGGFQKQLQRPSIHAGLDDEKDRLEKALPTNVKASDCCSK